LYANYHTINHHHKPPLVEQISNQSSYALVNLIPESRRILTGVSPVTCKKAVKNPVEIEGMRRAHVSHLLRAQANTL